MGKRESMDELQTMQTKDVLARVRQIVAETLMIEPDEVQDDTLLVEELSADSMDFVEITYRLEIEYGIRFYEGPVFEDLEALFRPETLSENDELTEHGVIVLRARMPEIDSAKFAVGMPTSQIEALLTPATFARSVVEMVQVQQRDGGSSRRAAPRCTVLAPTHSDTSARDSGIDDSGSFASARRRQATSTGPIAFLLRSRESSECASGSRDRSSTGIPMTRARLRTEAASNGRAAFVAATSRTSAVRASRKLASTRERGPFEVI